MAGELSSPKESPSSNRSRSERDATNIKMKNATEICKKSPRTPTKNPAQPTSPKTTTKHPAGTISAKKQIEAYARITGTVIPSKRKSHLKHCIATLFAFLLFCALARPNSNFGIRQIRHGKKRFVVIETHRGEREIDGYFERIKILKNLEFDDLLADFDMFDSQTDNINANNGNSGGNRFFVDVSYNAEFLNILHGNASYKAIAGELLPIQEMNIAHSTADSISENEEGEKKAQSVQKIPGVENDIALLPKPRMRTVTISLLRWLIFVDQVSEVETAKRRVEIPDLLDFFAVDLFLQSVVPDTWRTIVGSNNNISTKQQNIANAQQHTDPARNYSAKNLEYPHHIGGILTQCEVKIRTTPEMGEKYNLHFPESHLIETDKPGLLVTYRTPVSAFLTKLTDTEIYKRAVMEIANDGDGNFYYTGGNNSNKKRNDNEADAENPGFGDAFSRFGPNKALWNVRYSSYGNNLWEVKRPEIVAVNGNKSENKRSDPTSTTGKQQAISNISTGQNNNTNGNTSPASNAKTETPYTEALTRRWQFQTSSEYQGTNPFDVQFALKWALKLEAPEKRVAELKGIIQASDDRRNQRNFKVFTFALLDEAELFDTID